MVWNIFYFPIYWVANHPNWLIFFRGVAQPPTSLVLKNNLANLTIPSEMLVTCTNVIQPSRWFDTRGVFRNAKRPRQKADLQKLQAEIDARGAGDCFLVDKKGRLWPDYPGEDYTTIWGFPYMERPQNGWFRMENPIKMDDLGVPLFQETPI